MFAEGHKQQIVPKAKKYIYKYKSRTFSNGVLPGLWNSTLIRRKKRKKKDLVIIVNGKPQFPEDLNSDIVDKMLLQIASMKRNSENMIKTSRLQELRSFGRTSTSSQ